MYYKSFIGHIVPNERFEKGRGDTFKPPLTDRDRYYYWYAVIDSKICENCLEQHEKIFSRQESPELYDYKHIFCRCIRIPVEGIEAGSATKDGINGADWWLKHYSRLPDYYISKEDLEILGWSEGDRPSQYVQGKMLTVGLYQNRSRKLPESPGRIWYEADINYTPGRRNLHRIVWSNDGLIFVTYDHYETFYEIY